MLPRLLALQIDAQICNRSALRAKRLSSQGMGPRAYKVKPSTLLNASVSHNATISVCSLTTTFTHPWQKGIRQITQLIATVLSNELHHATTSTWHKLMNRKVSAKSCLRSPCLFFIHFKNCSLSFSFSFLCLFHCFPCLFHCFIFVKKGDQKKKKYSNADLNSKGAWHRRICKPGMHQPYTELISFI